MESSPASYDGAERFEDVMHEDRHPSSSGAPTIHAGDATRAVMPLLVALGIARFALFSENHRLEPLGWVVFLVVVTALVASGVRIALLEARPPRDPRTFVARTRELAVGQEVVIAGMGAFLLWMGLMSLVLSGTTEIWAGVVSQRSISVGEITISLLTLGLPGFFMVYWRPMFVLDASAGTIRRHPFGRALGIGKTLPASSLRVFSEGYFVTNTGRRIGEMIRGRVGKATFELELVAGEAADEHVRRRVAFWSHALGVGGG